MMHRWFRRGFAWLALPALLVLACPPAAAVTVARIGWCRSDPVIDVAGTKLRVDVSSSREIRDSVTGPTQVMVLRPSGVPVDWELVDDGFAGQGYNVEVVDADDLRVTEGGTQVQIRVYVPAADALPVRVKLADDESDDPLDRDDGRTNRWVTVEALA
jgi:hypothetical protein